MGNNTKSEVWALELELLLDKLRARNALSRACKNLTKSSVSFIYAYVRNITRRMTGFPARRTVADRPGGANEDDLVADGEEVC